jgi:hypothetical protein
VRPFVEAKGTGNAALRFLIIILPSGGIGKGKIDSPPEVLLQAVPIIVDDDTGRVLQ